MSFFNHCISSVCWPIWMICISPERYGVIDFEYFNPILIICSHHGVISNFVFNVMLVFFLSISLNRSSYLSNKQNSLFCLGFSSHIFVHCVCSDNWLSVSNIPFAITSQFIQIELITLCDLLNEPYDVIFFLCTVN